jgi:carbonic anhydrase
MHTKDDLNKMVKSKEVLSMITPKIAKQMLIDGNKRFLAKEPIERDHEWHMRETLDSQHPMAIVLGCIDSRVQPNICFDQGIGDLFIARVAGNIINQDILGSMEYACKVVGSKLIVVLGHTACGAVKGACDDFKMGNLTSAMRHIQLAVERTLTPVGTDRSSKNIIFVDKVAKMNVHLAVEDITAQSEILKQMYEAGEIDIVGAIYHHSNGEVEFCD